MALQLGSGRSRCWECGAVLADPSGAELWCGAGVFPGGCKLREAQLPSVVTELSLGKAPCASRLPWKETGALVWREQALLARLAQLCPAVPGQDPLSSSPIAWSRGCGAQGLCEARKRICCGQAEREPARRAEQPVQDLPGARVSAGHLGSNYPSSRWDGMS